MKARSKTHHGGLPAETDFRVDEEGKVKAGKEGRACFLVAWDPEEAKRS